MIAIGGISEENVGQLAGSGICGVAVISAIFAKPDVKKAAQELKKAVEEWWQKEKKHADKAAISMWTAHSLTLWGSGRKPMRSI